MNGVFLLIFACGWSTLLLMFDVQMGRELAQQFGSRNYPAVVGEVLHSEVTRHRGSKGKTVYGVDIRYRYQVDDRSFEGKRFRYDPGLSRGSAWAVQAVAAHPVGSPARVFYQPQKPQEALLSVGLDGSDLMMVLFLMPFNMIMLGLWTWMALWLGQRLFRPVAGGVRITVEGPRTRVCLPQSAPWVWGMATLGGLSFLAIVVLGLACGSELSLTQGSVALFLVAAAAAGAYGWRWQKIHSGHEDLILDESSGTFELPKTYGRRERVALAFSAVKRLSLETIEHRGSKGTSYTYAPTLWVRGAGPRGQKLADWYDKMKAEAFTDWLRQRLRETGSQE